MFDFDLILDNLDNVPDEFKGLYTAGDDGKFNLAPALAEKLKAGGGAHTALAKERKDKANLEKIVKAFRTAAGVETPEELTERITTLEDQANKASGADERVANVKKDLEDTYQGQITTLTTTLANERADSDRDFRDRNVMDAISAAEAIPEALRPILRERVSTVRSDDNKRSLVIKDENGEEVLDGHGNPITLKAYVEKLKADEKYGFAFKPSGALGAGAGNGNGNNKNIGGVNPFKKETQNLTEAQKLIASNPERARALAQQAGYPVTW